MYTQAVTVFAANHKVTLCPQDLDSAPDQISREGNVYTLNLCRSVIYRQLEAPPMALNPAALQSNSIGVAGVVPVLQRSLPPALKRLLSPAIQASPFSFGLPARPA